MQKRRERDRGGSERDIDKDLKPLKHTKTNLKAF